MLPFLAFMYVSFVIAAAFWEGFGEPAPPRLMKPLVHSEPEVREALQRNMKRKEEA